MERWFFPRRVYTCAFIRRHPSTHGESPVLQFYYSLPYNFIKASPLATPLRNTQHLPLLPSRCPPTSTALPNANAPPNELSQDWNDCSFTACRLQVHTASWKSKPRRLVLSVCRCSCLQNTQHIEGMCGNSSTFTDGFKWCGVWAHHVHAQFFPTLIYTTKAEKRARTHQIIESISIYPPFSILVFCFARAVLSYFLLFCFLMKSFQQRFSSNFFKPLEAMRNLI